MDGKLSRAATSMKTVILLGYLLCTIGQTYSATLYSFADHQVLSENETLERLSLDSPFILDGEPYFCFHINVAGIISFFGPVEYNPSISTLERLQLVTPAITPLWTDLDFDGGDIYYRKLASDNPSFLKITTDLRQANSSFSPDVIVVVTWDNVRPLNSSLDSSTFQVILATDGKSSFVMFRYESLHWTSSKISPAGGPAVGIVGEDSLLHLVYSQSENITDLLYDSNYENSTGVYLYSVHGSLDKVVDPTLQMCVDGQIRLQGSSYINEGRVEICHHNDWYGVCHNLWDTTDAAVVCQQLGFDASDSLAVSKEIFGQFFGQFLLDNVECSGFEDNLDDCLSEETDAFNCSTKDYASVICSEILELGQVCLKGSVRLVGACSDAEGRIEVCSNNYWSSICDDGGFDEKAAEVACKQLGYAGTGASSQCCSMYGEGKSAGFVDSIYCNGSESSLSECSITFNNSSRCYQNVTSVTCTPKCVQSDTSSKFGTYMWPKTAAEMTVVDACEYDILENVSGYVERTCGPDGIWEDAIYFNCSTESEYILQLIRDDNVTDNNIQGILQALHNATSLIVSFEDQTAESLSIITDVVKNLGECSCIPNSEVAEEFVNVLNDVMEWTAPDLNPMSIDITENFEKALSSSPGLLPSASQNGTLTMSSSGITYTRLQSNSSNYISNGLTYQSVKNENEITGGLLMADGSRDTESSLASIRLPDVLFERLDPSVNFEALFVVYENPDLFPVQIDSDSRRVASTVISATILNQAESVVANLSSDVLITLTLTSRLYRSPECVFWDTVQQAWSSEGCKNVTEEDFVGATVTCRCNHLSTFGVVANTNPMSCPEGYTNNFDATLCIGIKPGLVLYIPSSESISNSIEVKPWEELEIDCFSSKEFPGNVTWKKWDNESETYEDVPEIDISGGKNLSMPSSTLGSHEVAILMTEVPGQLYAYRLNDTHVTLGTRKADVFGAAVGIDFVANGTYQCFAANQYSNTSTSISINVHELSDATNYIRFTVEPLKNTFNEFPHSNNINQTIELLLGIISTALQRSYQENTSNIYGTYLVNCTVVPSWDNNTRISCQFLNATGIVNKTHFIDQLPDYIMLVKEFDIIHSAAGFCDAEEMFQSEDNRGSFAWNETVVGNTSKSSCFYGAHTEGGYATRKCLEHQTWGPYDGSACCTTYNSKLCSLTNITTEKEAEEAVGTIANTIADIPVAEQTPQTFGVVTSVYEEISTLIRDGRIVATDSMTSSTVRVLSLVSDWPADSISQSSSSLVSSFEGITTSLVSQKTFKNIHFNEDNLDFLAKKVGADVLNVENNNNYDLFNRPREVYSGLPNEKRSNNKDFVIQVPEELVENSDSYIYTLYETPALFQVVPPNATNDTFTTEVDSMVVGFSLVKGQEEKTVSNIRQPVIITFRSLTVPDVANISRVDCVSWDFEAIQLGKKSYRGNWTDAGCYLNDRESSIKDGIYVCHCTHLTNFAVLVATGDPPPLSAEASIITVVGCFLSILGLSATLVSLIIFKNIRRKVITKFHFQLCLSLLFLYLAFLIGIDRIEVEGVCSAMSFFIQYFALATFLWTGAESVVMLKTFVFDVFGHTTWKFILIISIICWTAPLFFAIVTVIVSQSTPINYMVTLADDESLQYCFMSDYKVHVALFLIPMYAIIIFNVVAFILVAKVLINQAFQKKKRTLNSDTKEDAEAVLRVILGIFSIMILFGLFWLIGVLNVSKAAVYFQWPFLILNTSLGAVIFVLIGILNARKEWKELFLKQKKGAKGSKIPLRSKDAVTTSKSNETRFSALPTDSRGRAVSQDFSSNKELESEMKIPDDIKV